MSQSGEKLKKHHSFVVLRGLKWIREDYTFFFISNLVAKGEGLVLVKKLSNSLSNLKGYTYKIQKNFTKCT